MLYELAHFLQNKVKPIWALVEAVNAGLFRLRYGRRLRQLPDAVAAYPGVFRARIDDIPDLASFFSNQPEEAISFCGASLLVKAIWGRWLTVIVRDRGLVVRCAAARWI